MIVDTSALIAILRDEPEARACADAIENSAVRRVSAGTRPLASRLFDDLIKEAQITLEPLTLLRSQGKQVRIPGHHCSVCVRT